MFLHVYTAYNHSMHAISSIFDAVLRDEEYNSAFSMNFIYCKKWTTNKHTENIYNSGLHEYR